MFEVEVDHNKYQVDFRHHQGNSAIVLLGLEGTTCRIACDIGIVGVGTTAVNPSDNYDKNLGRKLSLRRALKKAEFTRDQRIIFWDKYFETRGKVN